MSRRLVALTPFLLALAGSCERTRGEAMDPAGQDAGADSPADGTDGATIDLAGKSFDVQLIGECLGPCGPVTLHVAGASPTTLSIVWSSSGRAAVGELAREGAKWKLTSPIQLEALPKGWNMCPGHRDLATATLELSDHDTDGVVELSGVATLSRTECSDDTGEITLTADVALAGEIDDTAPSAQVSSAGGLNPLGVVVSEALQPTATATLSVPGAPHALSPILAAGYVVGFRSDLVLPLGAQLSLLVNGSDLAGVGKPAPLVVTTPPDFGVLTQDGFEGGSSQGMLGGAQLVDGFAGEPAITGTKMLYLAPGASALLRLQRVSSEGNIAMETRIVSACSNFAGSIYVAAGVIGGAQRQQASFTTSELSPLPADAGAMQIGKQAGVLVPIPEAGKDVLLHVSGDYYEGSGCAKVGVLIDDLRLE
ncbi:MAG: hypothetical protein HS104_29525 [Polyangiaceae bacterium]|nr:hypothetical protein [Polyangiaceae bacterium]MCL4753074.1 hypothetical protein [Myxococcales bacterium]